MTLRSLAATASVVISCLASTALPVVSGEAPRDLNTPLAIAAVQGTAPNFTGINKWFNSAPLNIADLRGKILAVANPGSASDFAAKLFLARQGMKPGQDISLIYSGSTSAAFAALVNGRVQAIFATSPNDLQAAQAGFKPLLELGDLNIPYAGNCSAAMRPYMTKQPARMRSFVAGITEAIAYIRRRPSEAKGILQKYTRVSDPSILQHAYDSDTRYMEPVPRPTSEGTKTILENLGVSGRTAEQFVTEFNNDEFIKQITDEGLLKQIYPSGVPALR